MRKNIVKFWLGIFIISLSMNLYAEDDYTNSQDYKLIEKSVIEALKNTGIGFLEDKTVKATINATLTKSLFFIQDLMTNPKYGIPIRYMDKFGAKADTTEILLKAFKDKSIGLDTKVKKFLPSKLDIALFPLDIAVEFSKVYYTRNLSDQYQKPAQWAITYSYTLIKSGIIYAVEGKAKAASEFIVGNAYLLADIGKENYKASKEALESKTAKDYSEQMSKALDIEHNIAKIAYKKSTNLDAINYINKYFPEEYQNQIIEPSKKKLFNKNLLYKLKADLVWRQANLIDMAKGGRDILLNTYINSKISKDRYLRFINFHFPDEEYDVLEKLYDASNYNPKLGVRTNKQAAFYLKQLNAYKITWKFSRNTIFNGNKVLTPSDAFAYIIGATKKIRKELFLNILVKNELDKYSSLKNKSVVSQDKIAHILIEKFKLKDKLTAKQIGGFTLLGNKSSTDTVNSLILKYFGILDKKKAFSASKNINNITLLMWTTKALNINTCGQVICSFQDIIERGN